MSAINSPNSGRIFFLTLKQTRHILSKSSVLIIGGTSIVSIFRSRCEKVPLKLLVSPIRVLFPGDLFHFHHRIQRTTGKRFLIGAKTVALTMLYAAQVFESCDSRDGALVAWFVILFKKFYLRGKAANTTNSDSERKRKKKTK